MSGGYQAYGEYKESNIRFLDRRPSYWSFKKIKRMLVLKRELVGYESSFYQLLSLTLKGVIPRDISTGEGKIPASFDTYQSVEKNDLVFCLFDIDETPRTVGIATLDGMITGAYNIYKCTSECVANYAYYYFLHLDYFKGLKPFYTGLRKVVRSETFGNIEMFCPSWQEQTQIATFLDHETAKIDTLIEKQNQLIELLKEKRQAVISHAVTKGLNYDVQMKDSGVEWLGEVPEHWNVKRLGAFFEERRHKVSDKDFSALSVTMKGIVPQLDSAAKTEAGDNRKLVLKNDFFINSRSDRKGSSGVSELNGSVSLISIVLKPKIIIPQFSHHLLRSYLFQEEFYRCGKGIVADLWSTNYSEMKNILIPEVPKSESELIIAFLDHETAKIDTLIELQQQQINLLNERRTALISAAVTGKIDVRKWRAPQVVSESKIPEATA